MLVLSRREGESVCVGGGVVVTVVRICGNKVRIGVAAEEAPILRAELREKDEPVRRNSENDAFEVALEFEPDEKRGDERKSKRAVA